MAINKWHDMKIGIGEPHASFLRFTNRIKDSIDSCVADGVRLPNETMFRSHEMIYPTWIVGKMIEDILWKNGR